MRLIRRAARRSYALQEKGGDISPPFSFPWGGNLRFCKGKNERRQPEDCLTFLSHRICYFATFSQKRIMMAAT